MKNKFKFAFIIPAILLTGCSTSALFGKEEVKGSGEFADVEVKGLVGDVLTVKDIDLSADKIVEVNIHQSDEEKKIVMNADTDIAEHITIKAENKEIKILGKAIEEYNTEKLTIDIYGYVFSTLNFSIAKATIESTTLDPNKFELNVSAASDIKINGTYTLAEGVTATMNVSGASKVNASRIDGDEMVYNISGASDVYVGQDNTKKCTANVSGVSKLTHGSNSSMVLEEMILNLSGTSQYYSLYRYASKVTMQISGVSSAKTRVLDTLNVTASGSSICYYLTTNDALQISKNLTGGSKLQQL